MKPNIFELATKELSRDAFFTWLLSYADESNKEHNEELSACAKDFISCLSSNQLLPQDIKKVEAGRQWDNIDIWAVINDKILIIIEDKTNTKQHNNQLERYKEIAKKDCQENNYQELFCIYLKTGAESQASINDVEKQGFSIIGIEDLLNIFNKYDIKNDIFNDFHTSLQQIYEGQKSFENKLIKEWDWANWQGFYTYLDSTINVNGWGYVSNPSGGFLGLWWHGHQKDNYWVGLQIESKSGRLCFKMWADSNQAEYKNEWHSIIMAKTAAENKNEIIRPKVLRSGKSMTVAIVERKDWLGADDIKINKEAVVSKLKDYEKFLDSCIS